LAGINLSGGGTAGDADTARNQIVCNYVFGINTAGVYVGSENLPCIQYSGGTVGQSVDNVIAYNVLDGNSTAKRGVYGAAGGGSPTGQTIIGNLVRNCTVSSYDLLAGTYTGNSIDMTDIPGLSVANTFVSGQTVGDGTGNAYFLLDGAAGSTRAVRCYTGGVLRAEALLSTDPETGSNAGSDFKIRTRDDAGAILDTPLAIARATGKTTLKELGLTTALAIGDGGTGATTANAARTALGLDTMATQSAASVAITGGSITGITDLAVADGGTGASDAATARTNLGLGTVATYNTGTSGAVVPLCNGNNHFGNSTYVGDGTADAYLFVNGAAGSNRYNRYQSNGVLRWDFGANTNAESGSDAGSDFAVRSFTDAGAYKETPLQITRSTGNTVFKSITLTTDLAVADGGTGASDAATARTNLGLGTIATQSAASVAIPASQTWLLLMAARGPPTRPPPGPTWLRRPTTKCSSGLGSFRPRRAATASLSSTFLSQGPSILRPRNPRRALPP